METISSLLAKAMGNVKEASGKDKVSSFDDLPKSIQELVKSINKESDSRKNTEKANMSAAERRQNQINELQRQFNENVKELADVTEALKNSNEDALKQAEKRTKREESRRNREEAARKRAEKLSAVKTRQNAEKNEVGANFLGAIFGKGIGDFVSNALKAQEKTTSEIAEVAEARYEAKVGEAEDIKAEKFEAAEIEKEAAVTKAATDYRQRTEEAAKSLGAAIPSAKENDAALAMAEAAKADLEAAKAERDKIAAEGAARLAEVPQPQQPSVGGTTEATTAPAPLIVTPDGRDAIAEAKAARTREEVASRNLEADAIVAKAADAFAAATRSEGAAPAGYSGAILQGEATASSTRAAGAEAKYAVMNADIAETKAKGEAEDEARIAAREAYAEKATGNLVSKEESRGIGLTNMLTTAVAPPALTIIASVMEKFRDMFPVWEQSGQALIEMGTAIPATLTAGMFKAGSLILGGLNAVKEALPGGQSGVSKRYEKKNAAYFAQYGRTRGEEYGLAYEARVAEVKKASEEPTLYSSDSGLSNIKATPAKANAPRPYTVEGTGGTMSGIAHVASTAKEAKEIHPAPPMPQRENQALGVVPVAASNRSVDEWRR